MTIKEAQELVDAWVFKHPAQKRSELTNMALLTEEIGELARIIATKYSDPDHDPVAMRSAMGEELADVFWALVSIANQSGVDLTDALIGNLAKKNEQ